MNPWEPNLDRHDNYNPNLIWASYFPHHITLLYPGLEELNYRNEYYRRNFLFPLASGSLESLVAQGTFLCTTNKYELPPRSVVCASPDAANMTSSLPLKEDYTNMGNTKPFTDNNKRSSVPSVPAPASLASQLKNNLGSTSSTILHVKPNNITDVASYQGEASQQKGRKGKNKSKGQQPLTMIAKQRRAASLHNAQERKRRERINRSLGTLRTMSGTNTNKDTASMLEGVTSYVKLLETQLKMANIMNIAPKDVTLPMQHHLEMSTMDPSLKSGDVVMEMDSGTKSTGYGVGPVNTTNTVSRSPYITKTSIVHPTVYVPPTFSSNKQTIDPVFAHTSTQIMDPISAYVAAPEPEIIYSAQVMDPISDYVVAREYERPSMEETAKMTATLQQFNQNLNHD